VPSGETPAARQERQHRRDEMRRVLIRSKEEIAAVQAIQERYQPGSQSHGFVWIFLRQRADGPKAGPWKGR
jgi:hypothetical protein